MRGEMRDEVRWGIVGCGNVTELKSGSAFQRARGSRLVAVMRRRGALAADYAKRHGVAHWFDSVDALVACPEVDAVYVATPPGSHVACAMKALAAGKATYVEKPMARCASECTTMVDAFAAARVPLFVAFYRRALPRFLRAKELVESGALGKITAVTYRYTSPTRGRGEGEELPWRLQATEAGGGLFMDLGCHTLDVLDFILGPLEDVQGSATNVASPYDVEDTVAMRFRTRSGALGVALWSFASAVRDDSIEIIGDAGRLSVPTFGDAPLRLEARGTVEAIELPNPKHIQEPLVQSIVDELLGRGTCASTGVTALRTARVMDAVLASYYGSRDDAFWNRPETWPRGRAL